MLIATPLGLGAAMYLSEYANPRIRRKLKPILETLAGIPSVVLGYFALVVINPVIVQDLLGATSPFSIMAAGIGVGHPDDPSRGVGGRGRHVRGARSPARGCLRHRCAPQDRHDEGRLPCGRVGDRGRR